MSILVVAVGKLKEKYLQPGIDEYLKRIKRFSKIELLRVKEEVKSEKKGEQEAILREGERILNTLSPRDKLIALSEEGKLFSSKEFAEFLQKIQSEGQGRLVFAIGSGPGLSLQVKERADFLLSLSPLTFPHQLALLLLLEQLYRSYTILNNLPYHR